MSAPKPSEKEQKQENDEKQEKQAANSDEEQPLKPKKTRKSYKFDVNFLMDEDIGLTKLYKHLQSFDPNLYPDQPEEALEKILIIYKKWMHRLYPSDFDETARRIAKAPSAKRIVREFIYEVNGGDPYIYDEGDEFGEVLFPSLHKRATNEENPAPVEEEPKQNPPPESTTPKEKATNFLSDQESDNGDASDSQDIPDILDLFSSQRN